MAMADMLVRPSMKFIRLGYILVLVLVLAAAVAVFSSAVPGAPPWTPAVVAVLLLWPAARHLRQRLTSIRITADKLRYESGFFSKTTRTIQLPKVQDVRVDQTLGQRIAGVGNLSIETAGETSRLTIGNIDGPQAVADRIIDASRKGEGAHGV
jgi:uncharacterized membrane protein YdbT with pleckstrin-like domain